MTRDDDRFVPLGERVKIARGGGADLFISIHADSLTQAQDVRGATIYTGSERATDAEAARLAAKENQADAVAGLDSSEEVQDVAGILMDLAKRETRTFSSVFARNLVEKLGGSVKMHKVPLRSAGFRVLSAPDVPSVLIELGYMSSPKDAELLNSAGLADAGRGGRAGRGRRLFRAGPGACRQGCREPPLFKGRKCAASADDAKCGRKATVPPSPSCYRT
jgi:N-acetylmuramoyl-L-alanine amidase